MSFIAQVQQKYAVTASSEKIVGKESLKLSMQQIPHRHPDMFAEEPEPMYRVSAKQNGKEVGWAEFGYHPGVDEYVAFSVEVDEDFRRKGVATALYDFFEKKKHVTLQPFPGGHSKDARKFWNKRISKNRSKYPDSDNWG